MHKLSQDKHEFAVFVDHYMVETGDVLRLCDEKLLHRMIRVLRFADRDLCILFDHQYSWRCVVVKLSSKEGLFRVVNKQPHKPLVPTISWTIPLLEAADFEEAVYALTVMGAASLQPVISQKSHRKSFRPQELQRLERIMIAAAEQSKQFLLPTMLPILDFNVWMQKKTFESSYAVFFDAVGIPCFQMVQNLRNDRPNMINCLVGPEGDLTLQEKAVLKDYFHIVALTPTVLRSSHAVMVGMGILRSCLQ